MSTPETGRPTGRPAGLPSLDASGIEYTLTEHGPVSSLAEAAAARGVEPDHLVKTLVVRRGEGDYVFVLVPGTRAIAWPKLRATLGVNRLSMPSAEEARAATGYPRGSITPFGSTTAWPVVADLTLRGRTVSIGAGAPGAAVTVDADALIAVLAADVADVTEPEPGSASRTPRPSTRRP
ncbi:MULTISPECIES: aminoacyl-tRNA deacylase [Citricoccus]|uniref:aminoacyl-tRNA deacylase n=1 Tax=Citricoccus TaxID=169133 RepID=UPI000255F4AD|nr:YbaK/EbsC family protein [Citricoccus sp. CH26A]